MYQNPFEAREAKPLKEIIKERVGSQRELARRTGIKEVTINSWVAGRKMPSFENAVIVAKSLDIDLKTLAQSLGLDVAGLPSESSFLP
jgi:transcriptional regulator with XRE-family HTH domain